jgi:S1-C subfamily serine protease
VSGPEAGEPSLLTDLNEALANVVSATMSSLVQVRDERAGAGAGVILHPQGLVLTSAHVIRGGQIHVGLQDGRRLPARVLGRSPARDLALLDVETGDLPAIELGDSQSLAPGAWVMALGHPWGVPGGTTAGVVIGVDAHLPEAPPRAGGLSWIAVSAHLRPGHSGGPLVDHAGRLVGINTMMAGPNVGLAVPVEDVKGHLHDLLGSRIVEHRESMII